MKKVELSIIIPVYNVGKYLERCIASLISQTYGEMEILLIDDGSTDKSGEMCDFFESKYENVKAFHKSNGGQSSARNLGLMNATGQYIAFVDSDDFVHPQMFEILMRQAKETDSDMVACGHIRYTEVDLCEFERISHLQCHFDVVQGEYVIEHYWEFAKQILGMAPWNKVYKKEIFQDNFFKEGIIYEDHYILPSILERCKRISYTDLKLYYYYQSANSTMRSSFSVKRLDAFDVWINSIFPFLEKYDHLENINMAREYYIDEFKNVCFTIEHLRLKNIKVPIQYKKYYNRFIFLQNRLSPKNTGKFGSVMYFMSVISMKVTYIIGNIFFKKKFSEFWVLQ